MSHATLDSTRVDSRDKVRTSGYKSMPRHLALVAILLCSFRISLGDVPISDSHIVFSPYNWYRSGSSYAQSANPGAYLKVGFTGTKIAVDLDESPLGKAGVPAAQYPVVRYSIDGRPSNTVQLEETSSSIPCAVGLPPGNHTLLLQYVAGYVFLDFWTPLNVVRVTGFSLDEGALLLEPSDSIAKHPLNALFLGDSITNGDDDIANFKVGITNAVNTQDATIGYPSVVAAGVGAEYGVVAYGGASWDGTAADGNTPGLMNSYSMLDKVHSRMVAGKLSPVPDDIYINMGENSGPTGDDVPKLLSALRAASSSNTNIFVIVPFSGRSRSSLTNGYAAYRKAAPRDVHSYLIDLGNNHYLTASGPTMLSVDGQHPLATLHAMLGAQLVQARALKLNAASIDRRH